MIEVTQDDRELLRLVRANVDMSVAWALKEEQVLQLIATFRRQAEYNGRKMAGDDLAKALTPIRGIPP